MIVVLIAFIGIVLAGIIAMLWHKSEKDKVKTSKLVELKEGYEIEYALSFDSDDNRYVYDYYLNSRVKSALSILPTTQLNIIIWARGFILRGVITEVDTFKQTCKANILNIKVSEKNINLNAVHEGNTLCEKHKDKLIKLLQNDLIPFQNIIEVIPPTVAQPTKNNTIPNLTEDDANKILLALEDKYGFDNEFTKRIYNHYDSIFNFNDTIPDIEDSKPKQTKNKNKKIV